MTGSAAYRLPVKDRPWRPSREAPLEAYPSRYGISGIIAPIANRTNDDKAASRAESVCRVPPSALTLHRLRPAVSPNSIVPDHRLGAANGVKTRPSSSMNSVGS